MKKKKVKIKEKSPIISDAGIETDVLFSRSVLNLFVRYIRNISLSHRLAVLFDSLKKSRKGQPIVEIFKQFRHYLLTLGRRLLFPIKNFAI